MSWIICAVCRGTFNTDDDPDCWAGPNEDLPICEKCREEEASYENQAHPVKTTNEIPNILEANRKYHRTNRPPRR